MTKGEIEKFLEFVAEAGSVEELNNVRYWAYSYIEFLNSQASDETKIINENETNEKKCSLNYPHYSYCPFMRVCDCDGCSYYK